MGTETGDDKPRKPVDWRKLLPLPARSFEIRRSPHRALALARARVRRLEAQVAMDRRSTLDNASKFLPNGRYGFIYYIEQAAKENDSLIPLVRAWRKLSDDERAGPRGDLDQLCAKHLAGMLPKTILGIVAGEAFETSIYFGELLAAAAHTKVIERSLKEAQKPKGVQDRFFHFSHTGYLPRPKGQSERLPGRPG
jgi:hypothetical protein